MDELRKMTPQQIAEELRNYTRVNNIDESERVQALLGELLSRLSRSQEGQQGELPTPVHMPPVVVIGGTHKQKEDAATALPVGVDTEIGIPSPVSRCNRQSLEPAEVLAGYWSWESIESRIWDAAMQDYKYETNALEAVIRREFEGLRSAISAPLNGWRKVEVELPKERGHYWCWRSDTKQGEKMYFSKKGEWSPSGSDNVCYAVTHWQPLPSPPIEAKGAGE